MLSKPQGGGGGGGRERGDILLGSPGRVKVLGVLEVKIYETQVPLFDHHMKT